MERRRAEHRVQWQRGSTNEDRNMINPYDDIEELDDAIRQELETRGHDVWLSEILADILRNDQHTAFARDIRRHLDSKLLPQANPGDEA
jgi:hypothetical protein